MIDEDLGIVGVCFSNSRIVIPLEFIFGSVSTLWLGWTSYLWLVFVTVNFRTYYRASSSNGRDDYLAKRKLLRSEGCSCMRVNEWFYMGSAWLCLAGRTDVILIHCVLLCEVNDPIYSPFCKCCETVRGGSLVCPVIPGSDLISVIRRRLSTPWDQEPWAVSLDWTHRGEERGSWEIVCPVSGDKRNSFRNDLTGNLQTVANNNSRRF